MGIAHDLLEHSNWVVDRTRRRFADLTDDELTWQPAPGSWTLRRLRDGRVIVDNRLGPGPPVPPPSIAWRLAHLIDVYGSARNARWLRATPATPPTRSAPWEIEPTAAATLARLEQAMTYWTEAITAPGDEEYGQPLGPGCEPYHAHTLVAFVHHQLDEAIHHGAEIALLRDLFPHRTLAPAHDPPEPTAAHLGVHDDAVARAADLGRWDLVEQLVLAGHAVATPGRNALHQACAIGDLALVELLLDHGADPTTTDPDFHGGALLWARYLDRTEVVALLQQRAAAT